MNIKFEPVNENIMLVRLQGRIDLETIESFVKCLNQLQGHKVIFDMRELLFVGSNGITVFIEALRRLVDKNKENVKFCYVGSEFKRIFTVTLGLVNEFYEEVDQARRAFTLFSSPNQILLDSTAGSPIEETFPISLKTLI